MQKKTILVASLLIGIFGYLLSTSKKGIHSKLGTSTYDNFISSKKIKDSIQIQEKTYENAPKIEITSENATNSNNIVVIGKSDDPGVFKRPNFMNNTYLFGKPHQDIEKNIQNNSAHIILKNIDKPMLMEFIPSGDKNFYRTNIYIAPNDTIHFEVKNEKIVFTGKNAAQNNLSTELKANTLAYNKIPYEGDLLAYKEKIKLVYKDKKQFFSNYIAKNKVSEAFISAFDKLLKFQYYDNLVSPRVTAVKNGDFYVNDYDALPSLIEKEYANSEIPFDISSYLENLTVEEFQDFEAMRHTHFLKNSVIVFIRHYFVKTDATPFSKEYLIAEKEFIEANFKGDIRHYAMGRMIWDYYNKGFAFGSQNIDFMVKTIDEYIDSVDGRETHIAAMQEIREDILTYDFELSESALNSKMMNHLGDTITLRDIFNRSDKRIKVVDFWASWCPPCIKQIQENKPFKDRLSVENNVEWIYLSIDSDKEKWLKKGEQLSESLHFRNSYLLLKGKKSSLARALEIHQIPRYLVVNQKNKIVVNNAPSPANEEAFEKIIDNILPDVKLITSNY
jgi:thiol-disulfide isomerase/thioredoxin